MAARVFQLRDATPEKQPIVLGITAPSGAGKTLSALRVAHGIQEVTGGDIAIIDTEGKRSARYATWPGFKFKRLDFDPPFGSLDYVDALQSTYDQGARTIIVDSASHEHEGQGGYLEMHESEIDRMLGDRKNDWKAREKATFTGWIRPAANRRKLINKFLQLGANFIFCFRAKEKIKVVSGGAPVPLGWQAIAGDEFVYEMIARCLLPPGANGIPDWSEGAFAHGAAKRDKQDEHLFPNGAQLSETIGRNLALAVNAKGAGPRIARVARSVDVLQSEGRDAADGGMAVLKTWSESLMPEERTSIKQFVIDVLQPEARAADEMPKEEF